MSDTEFDAIILGQGLAGTTLAWALRWRGLRFLIVDRDVAGTSSRIAAGLMTPITGSRLVKTWRWDQFWQVATEFYRRAEDELGTSFCFPNRLVRLIANASEQAYLDRRIASEFSGLVTRPQPLVDPRWFDDPLGGMEMIEGGRLNVAAYLLASRQRFTSDDQCVTADVDVNHDIELIPSGVRLPRLGLAARRLIFCQGIDGRGNSWFQHVRFNPAKGEILTLRIAGLNEERIVHRGVWLMPLGDGLFRAGATYEWNDLNSVPTPAGRDEICARLREFLRLPFEVIAHAAAVRPIVLHQYPVVGVHPHHQQLAFFNGLGSKGALQAPWLARHLAEFLFDGALLDPDVGPRRYDANIQPSMIVRTSQADTGLSESATRKRDDSRGDTA